MCEVRSLPAVTVPFEPLPRVSDEALRALEREALRLNDRYLYELVEGHAFCPFAKGGRQSGQTSRYFHYADTTDIEPLLGFMEQVASDPKQVVAQVIVPLIDVDPDRWIRFCDEVTAAGHARMGGPPVLAFAALHPRLRYDPAGHFSLIPLFRRSPDPTIQWVRLDALADIYEGRGTEHVYIDPADILTYVRDAPPPPRSLYERVAVTNFEVAHKIGVPRVEALAADQAEDARRSYARVLAEPGG